MPGTEYSEDTRGVCKASRLARLAKTVSPDFNREELPEFSPKQADSKANLGPSVTCAHTNRSIAAHKYVLTHVSMNTHIPCMHEESNRDNNSTQNYELILVFGFSKTHCSAMYSFYSPNSLKLISV